MDYPNFVRIEQEAANGESHHFVVHTRNPKLAVEFRAEVGPQGTLKPGVIRRVSVPNSWAGQYSQYAKLLAKAEKFFRASLDPSGETGGRLRPG